MLIRLKQPALALHSCDVPSYKHQMQTTWLMPAGANVQNVVYWIKTAIESTPDNYLNNVVINCHGNAGRLSVGGIGFGFGIEGVKLFEALRGANGESRIGNMWLTACLVGSNPKIGTPFCRTLAKAANCTVIAGDLEQNINPLLDKTLEYFRPFGCIDDFEGPVGQYDAEGGVFEWSNSFGTEY